MGSGTRWAAVVTAAGSGSRYGAGVPKQFMILRGKTVLDWSVDILAPMMPLVVALPPDYPWRDHWTPPPGVTVVDGGPRRQDSVLAALTVLDNPDFVLVHDGARPGLTVSLAEKVMSATEIHGAAVPGVRARDTLKRVRKGYVEKTVSRDGLYMIQTPQGFRFRPLFDALSGAGDVTDESSVLEKAGVPVAVVEGDPRNLKLTEPGDMSLFGQLPRFSFGQGLDFHPFGDDRPMIAGGCRLEETGGPVGHSDGDPVLHAASDALLAAASLGDTGVFHPPSDPKWLDADSSLILAGSMDRVREAGWRLYRLDLTLIGDRPRVAPHRSMMIGRISSILGVSKDRVWIKGTSTNTLGDLGRGAGFGCLALAVLES